METFELIMRRRTVKFISFEIIVIFVAIDSFTELRVNSKNKAGVAQYKVNVKKGSTYQKD